MSGSRKGPGIRQEIGGTAAELDAECRTLRTRVAELEQALRHIHGIAGAHGFGPLPFTRPSHPIRGAGDEKR